MTLSEEGTIETSTYADLHTRSQLCAMALQKLGVGCASSSMHPVTVAQNHFITHVVSELAAHAGMVTSLRQWPGTQLATWRRAAFPMLER